MVAYSETLYDAMYDLAAFPNLGRSQDNIAFGLRSYPAGEYTIFYRVTETQIRVIHGRRDAGSESIS